MKSSVVLLALTFAAFGQGPLTETVMARYLSAKQNLIKSAEAMPEDAYGFKPTAAQRPFSGWIGHVAMANYNFCSAIKGEKAPDTSTLHEMTTKSDLVAAIKKSFEYCDGALQGMTDQKAMVAATVNGKQSYAVQPLIGLVASSNEHYGNIVSYLRLKGVTPPSSNK